MQHGYSKSCFSDHGLLSHVNIEQHAVCSLTTVFSRAFLEYCVIMILAVLTLLASVTSAYNVSLSPFHPLSVCRFKHPALPIQKDVINDARRFCYPAPAFSVPCVHVVLLRLISCIFICNFRRLWCRFMVPMLTLSMCSHISEYEQTLTITTSATPKQRACAYDAVII